MPKGMAAPELRRCCIKAVPLALRVALVQGLSADPELWQRAIAITR